MEITADQAAAFRLARQRLHGTTTKGTGASGGRGATQSRGPAAGQRTGSVSSVVDVVAATAGIQAQVTSAAELSIWTRRRETTREEIRAALWERRELVKTSAMRLTLHLIPARDFAVYIAAMRPSSAATLQRWQSRLGMTRAHLQRLTDTILDALSGGALTQQELVARAKKRAPKGMRAWLDNSWGAVRPAVVEGLIVYGPPRGAEATFVRSETWLGTQHRPTTGDARAELMRRFLSAFGPATAGDFARWSGIKLSESRVVLESLGDEALRVSVDGAPGWILARDAVAVGDAQLNRRAVRLLPAFDTLLLAHATKEHLVSPEFFKKVYRPQGWISPVVLVGGVVVAVWFSKARGRAIEVDVQPFGRLTREVRDAIASEVDAMGRFLAAPCTVRFS